jgi:hypothetical protein
MRLLRVLSVPVLALSLHSCSEPIATLGPTPAGEGITIYIHAGFIGSSQALSVDVTNLEKVEGPCTSRQEGEQPTWGDCISSIRVEEGWSATLYRDDDFKGERVTLTESALDLRDLRGPCDGSFNDCVSSIRIRRR